MWMDYLALTISDSIGNLVDQGIRSYESGGGGVVSIIIYNYAYTRGIR